MNGFPSPSGSQPAVLPPAPLVPESLPASPPPPPDPASPGSPDSPDSPPSPSFPLAPASFGSGRDASPSAQPGAANMASESRIRGRKQRNFMPWLREIRVTPHFAAHLTFIDGRAPIRQQRGSHGFGAYLGQQTEPSTAIGPPSGATIVPVGSAPLAQR